MNIVLNKSNITEDTNDYLMDCLLRIEHVFDKKSDFEFEYNIAESETMMFIDLNIKNKGEDIFHIDDDYKIKVTLSGVYGVHYNELGEYRNKIGRLMDFIETLEFELDELKYTVRDINKGKF